MSETPMEPDPANEPVDPDSEPEVGAPAPDPGEEATSDDELIQPDTGRDSSL